jgi:hypothetical protein
VLAAFDDVMASAYSVCLIGRFEAPTIGTTFLKSVVAPGDYYDAPLERFGGRWDPDPMPGEHHTERAGRPEPWHERLPQFRPDFPPSVGGDELQSEHFVPQARHLRTGGSAFDGRRHRTAPVGDGDPHGGRR